MFFIKSELKLKIEVYLLNPISKNIKMVNG